MFNSRKLSYSVKIQKMEENIVCWALNFKVFTKVFTTHKSCNTKISKIRKNYYKATKTAESWVKYKKMLTEK